MTRIEVEYHGQLIHARIVPELRRVYASSGRVAYEAAVRIVGNGSADDESEAWRLRGKLAEWGYKDVR